MGHLFAMAALALTSTLLDASAPPVPTFAEMGWGTPAADVVKAVTAAGLTMVTRDNEGDYEFSGELFGVPAVVYAFISPEHGLVKVQVRLSAAADAPRQKYVEVVDSLSARYGKTEQMALFKPPYKEGDGQEDEAIRRGDGLLLSSWGDDAQAGQAALVVRVTRHVVGLDYESHGWTAELNRRKAEAASTSDSGSRVAD